MSKRSLLRPIVEPGLSWRCVTIPENGARTLKYSSRTSSSSMRACSSAIAFSMRPTSSLALLSLNAATLAASCAACQASSASSSAFGDTIDGSSCDCRSNSALVLCASIPACAVRRPAASISSSASCLSTDLLSRSTTSCLRADCASRSSSSASTAPAETRDPSSTCSCSSRPATWLRIVSWCSDSRNPVVRICRWTWRSSALTARTSGGGSSGSWPERSFCWPQEAISRAVRQQLGGWGMATRWRRGSAASSVGADYARWVGTSAEKSFPGRSRPGKMQSGASHPSGHGRDDHLGRGPAAGP